MKHQLGRKKFYKIGYLGQKSPRESPLRQPGCSSLYRYLEPMLQTLLPYRYTGCHYAKCCYVECWSAGCPLAEYRYADCHVNCRVNCHFAVR